MFPDCQWECSQCSFPNIASYNGCIPATLPITQSQTRHCNGRYPPRYVSAYLDCLLAQPFLLSQWGANSEFLSVTNRWTRKLWTSLVTDPPQTSSTTWSYHKKHKVTHDTCHVKRGFGWAFSQNFSSLPFTVCLSPLHRPPSMLELTAVNLLCS